MRRSLALSTAVSTGLLSLLAAGASPAPAAPSTARAAAPVVTLSQGHVDAIDVAVEDGAFALSVHDESVEPDVERDPASVRFLVKREAKVTVPDDPAYAFLGAPGSTVWVLPEVQQDDLLWLGLSAEEIQPGVLVGDQAKITFTRVVGPDGVSMFDTAQDGSPHVLADSEDAQPDVVPLAAGLHSHQSVAFEKAGRYEITYKVSGRLVAGNKQITSKLVTLTFDVQA